MHPEEWITVAAANLSTATLSMNMLISQWDDIAALERQLLGSESRTIAEEQFLTALENFRGMARTLVS